MRRRQGRGILGRRLRIGRLGVPIWGVALAAVVVAAAAGQAVGPVMTGSTSGTVNLVVEQAITLDTDLPLGSNPLATGPDWVTTRDDEGTGFTVAVESHTGRRHEVDIFLQNHSGQDASAVFQLIVPAGIDVEVEQISNGVLSSNAVIQEAMMTMNTWLMRVGAGAGLGEDDGLRITIESADDIAPGFYAISGRIVQTAG